MKYARWFTAALVLGAQVPVTQSALAGPAAPPMLAVASEPAEPAPTAENAAKRKAAIASTFTPATPVEASPSAGTPEAAPAPAAPVEEPEPMVNVPTTTTTTTTTTTIAPAPAEIVAEPVAQPAPAEPVAVAAPVEEAPKPKPKAKAKPKPAPAPAAPATPIVPFGSEGSGAIPALPLDIMTNGNVTYVTGGIGDEEMEMLKSRENDFNVHLLLTSTHGEYIGGVMVRVLNEQGQEVLTANDAGPYLYVKLPPGKYTLEGTATQGGIKSVKVNAPASGFTKAHIVYIE